jgi:hypothetical protein
MRGRSFSRDSQEILQPVPAFCQVVVFIPPEVDKSRC